MRLLVAAVFVTLLAPAPSAIACEDDDDEISRRVEQARARARATQARRAERARRDVERARREAARGRRQQAQPSPFDPYAWFKHVQPQWPQQPIDPYQDDKQTTRKKLERLQKKLDRLRDRLGKFQVPKPDKQDRQNQKLDAKPMRLEIHSLPEGELL